MEWIISVVVVLMASFLKGLTGFGFALLALPLLTLFFPMQVLVPAMAIFNLLSSLYILAHVHVKVSSKYILPMLLASFTGIPLGVYVLKFFPERLLELTTGISIFTISILFLLGNREVNVGRKNNPIVLAGFLSGIMSSSMSIGGPPIALAMNKKGYSKEYFRKIFALVSTVNASLSITLYFTKGIMENFSLKFAVFLLPVLLIGSVFGDILSKRIQQSQFKRGVLLLNMALGLFVIFRTVVLKN